MDASSEERVEGGEIVLREATLERLQVIADVLAKSVVLAYYEASLAIAAIAARWAGPRLTKPE